MPARPWSRKRGVVLNGRRGCGSRGHPRGAVGAAGGRWWPWGGSYSPAALAGLLAALSAVVAPRGPHSGSPPAARSWARAGQRTKCKASKCVRHMHAQGAPKRQSVCARNVRVRAPIRPERHSARADPHGRGACGSGFMASPGEGHVSVKEDTLPRREGLCCGLAHAL